MSKTTTFLLLILLIFISLLLFVLLINKQNPILTSFTEPLATPPAPPTTTTLSFAADEPSLQTGQTITIAVLIHNSIPHPSLVQLELSYDPTTITVDSIIPGTFFTNPDIVLQNIDPVAGRVSYAMRCPHTQSSADCVNASSPTVATLTMSVNRYAITNMTSLSFLPKTVVRTRNGKDILQKTSTLQLTITRPLYPVSSSSGIALPHANIIRITPAH